MLMTSGFPDRPHIHHLPDVDLDNRRRQLGRGRVEPQSAVTAGEHVTVTLAFELGETAVETGGHLRVAWLWPFDWSHLQTDDSEAAGYVSVSCSKGDVELCPRYAFRGDLIPWNHQIDVEITAGALQHGDAVEVTCRDWRAPTFVVPEAEFLLLINPDGGDRWWQVPPAVGFPIIAGEPARLFALAPADGLVDRDIELTFRIEDQWGNPLLLDGATPRVVAGDSVTASTAKPAGAMPAYHALVRFANTGIHRLEVAIPGTDLRAVTNPVNITAEPPPMRIFWGDVHAGQGQIGCGIGSVPHHFDYCRHVAGLQVSSHQANDHHISLDLWEQTRRESASAHEEDRFVAFLGCEWSAYTPDGGDRNVFYRCDESRLRRSGRFFTEDAPDPEPDLVTATEFLEIMRDQEVLINIHAGGRPTNLEFHEPRIETLAEIHSTHGTSDWFVTDALRRGYRLGITAGTDGVAGRPGADHPGSRLIRNARSGITAFLAPALTHAALWEAMAARRCYATDGERILLEVTVDGHVMGSEYETNGEPLVELSVEGTAAIEQVDLLCGTDVVWSWRLTVPRADEALRILWGGTENHGSAPNQRAFWDGSITIDNGHIGSVESTAFVTPDDRFERADEHSVSFTTVTAGNRMGLELQLDADDSTSCRFESTHATFEFALAQVRRTPMTVDAGGASRHVIVGPVPDPTAPKRVELSFRDTRARRGECPYWVRVTQVDQHRAWSSPVYVDRT